MEPGDLTVFIINPISGTRHKDSIPDQIRQRFPEESTEIIFTERSGHGYEIAAEKAAQGARMVVAVGGDGTVNEVASALVNTPAKLGIVPSGSGNGLARYLGIPLQVPEALDLLTEHSTRKIDVGKVNGRYFFCTFGTGFDASVGHKFATDSRRGMLSYVRATIHQFINYSPKKYILKTSHKKIRLKAFLVTFANAGQYGNNAYIAPNAAIDDGLLDLIILRPFPKTSTISLGLRLFFKNIDQSPYLEVMRVKKATLKRRHHKKMVIHLDGEPMTMHGKLKVNVVNKALEVVVPLKKKRRKKLLP
jgi:diacylglycerol kinase (ATP)